MSFEVENRCLTCIAPYSKKFRTLLNRMKSQKTKLLTLIPNKIKFSKRQRICSSGTLNSSSYKANDMCITYGNDCHW